MLVGQQELGGIPLLLFPAGIDQHPSIGLPDGVRPPFGPPVGAHLPVARPVVMDPPLALRVGESPNIVQPVGIFPSREAIMEAWEEHFDKPTKRKYWYNNLTKEASCWTIHAGVRAPIECS